MVCWFCKSYWFFLEIFDKYSLFSFYFYLISSSFFNSRCCSSSESKPELFKFESALEPLFFLKLDTIFVLLLGPGPFAGPWFVDGEVRFLADFAFDLPGEFPLILLKGEFLFSKFLLFVPEVCLYGELLILWEFRRGEACLSVGWGAIFLFLDDSVSESTCLFRDFCEDDFWSRWDELSLAFFGVDLSAYFLIGLCWDSILLLLGTEMARLLPDLFCLEVDF